jgi:hypothetical protein
VGAPGPVLTATGPQRPADDGRSELMRAAVAAEERMRQPSSGAKKRAATRRRRTTGSAKKAGGRSYRRVALILGLLLAGTGGAVGYSMYRRAMGRAANEGSGSGTGKKGNHTPEMRQVTLTLSSAGVIAKSVSYDADGDQVSYIIRWMVNNRPVGGAVSARLTSKFYKRGDKVQVLVTPTDPFGRGRPMLSQPLTIK